MRFTKLSYCQYLLSSQINYTITNLAEHLESISHEAINYYLKTEKLTPRLLWDNVKEVVEPDDNGYIIFDDSVLDKRYSEEIEIVRRQYSGNEHGVLKGIGTVSCVYVNPKLQRFWVIDYRIFNPDVDGKTKIDHGKDMLHLVYHKLLPFDTVLMDTWYAVHSLMLYIDSLHKIYYCPLKNNRLVDDTYCFSISTKATSCGECVKSDRIPLPRNDKLKNTSGKCHAVNEFYQFEDSPFN